MADGTTVIKGTSLSVTKRHDFNELHPEIRQALLELRFALANHMPSAAQSAQITMDNFRDFTEASDPPYIDSRTYIIGHVEMHCDLRTVGHEPMRIYEGHLKKGELDGPLPE